MKRTAMVAMGFVLAACAAAVSPEVLKQWQTGSRYTCCNIHYEKPDSLSDANYTVGALLPFGAPATVQSMTKKSVTFGAGGNTFTLTQAYGADQESPQQYFAKVLVETDPHVRFNMFSKSVQDAISNGRVEKGMTKEQVIMSLGYPPTHRTASTQANIWTYWYNRWVTFVVNFDEQGFVSGYSGSDVPTNNQPVSQVVAPMPRPTPPHGKKKH